MKILEIELDGIEKEVYDFLGLGQQNAVTAQWFELFKGINRRKLCRAVEHLRTKGVPVGSNRVGEHKGYYIIDNAAELNATIKQYESQIYKMMRIKNKLQENFVDDDQLELLLEEL